VPGLRIACVTERGPAGDAGESGPHEEVFVHEGGIAEFADFLAPTAPSPTSGGAQGTGRFTETVPVSTSAAT
jgi:DNA gyrase subunit B